MPGIHELAKEAGLNPFSPEGESGKRFNTGAALARFFNLIVQHVAAGETVRIKDFGTFRARKYKGRTLKSPLVKGGEISFADCMVLRFHQSTVAKKSLNAAAPAGGKKSKKDKTKKANGEATTAASAPAPEATVETKADKAARKAAKKAKRAAAAAEGAAEA